MGIPNGWELVIILGVLVLLFGATKLPTAARAIGQSMRIFKTEIKGSPAEGQPSSPASDQQSLPPTGPVATAHQQPRRPDDTMH